MEKVQVEILTDGIRLDGIDRSVGDIAELPQSLFSIWREKGYCKLKSSEPEMTEAEKLAFEKAEAEKLAFEKAEAEKLAAALKHVGGGYYLMPNGEKVKGKEAALEEIKALKGGEENGAKTDNSTDNGTGNNTGTGNEGLSETGRDGE